MTTLADYLIALAVDGSPDAAADYLLTYDVSAAALKRVLLSTAAGGGGGFAADYAQATYTAGAVSLGTSTDAAFVDVDATNLKVSITPAVAGKYLAIFTFGVLATGTSVQQFLRITDGTNSCHSVEHNVTGQLRAFTLSYIFNWTAAAQTVKLQKYILAASGLSSNVINIGTAGVGSVIVEAPDMQVMRIGS